MGVRITAYSHLQLTDPHPIGDDCWDSDHINAFVYETFQRSGDGLADMDKVTTLGRTQVRGGRCYVPTARTEKVDVLGMSYGGYGRWRRFFAEAVLDRSLDSVWDDPDPATPFVDLLNFADNEGTIGPDAAARLAGQFGDAKYLAKYTDGISLSADALHPFEGEWFMKAWTGWASGTRAAANNGLIEFR